jgi:hypothetical protein
MPTTMKATFCEPGGAEVVPGRSRQALVLTEDDTEHDAAAEAVRTARHGPRDAVAHIVTDTGDASAATHLPPRGRLQDDVDALAGQPLPLVEPSLPGRLSRLPHANVGLEDGAARRRATGGEHEQHPLSKRHAVERARDADGPDRPRRGAGSLRRDHFRRPRLSHARLEHALLQSLDPERAPGQPEGGRSQAEGRDPPPPFEQRDRSEAPEREQ